MAEVCYEDRGASFKRTCRMNTRSAALYTGLSEKTLAMMRCSGTGPKFIKRGRIFYFRDDVDAWLNARGRLTSTAQTNQKQTT